MEEERNLNEEKKLPANIYPGTNKNGNKVGAN